MEDETDPPLHNELPIRVRSSYGVIGPSSGKPRATTRIIEEYKEHRDSASSPAFLDPISAVSVIPRRATTHLIVETQSERLYIISSLGTRSGTQLIVLDPLSGTLQYCGIAGYDLFESEEQALEAIFEGSSRNLGVFKTRIRAAAIIGLIVIGNHARLFVATKVRRSGVLFGGHAIFTVLETQWVTHSVARGEDSVNLSELKHLSSLEESPLDGMHFYCESLDLTRPFPSPYTVDEYDPEFVWNSWLSRLFDNAGLGSWCIALLQGVALGRAVGDLSLCYIARKVNIHPGTRYTARGLDADAGVGNEVECEQICWTGTTEVDWRSFVWRRGTIPLWWRTELKTAIGEPIIIIRDKDPYDGSEKYFSHLVERFGAYPITCVSLLHDPNSNEKSLNDAYAQCLCTISNTVGVPLKFIDIDWLKLLRDTTINSSAALLWSKLGPSIKDCGLNSGSILLETMSELEEESPEQDHNNGHGVCPSGHIALFNPISVQKGVVRVNCLDSLDRTNLVSFFFCLQVLAEQCRSLSGLGLTDSAKEFGFASLGPWSLFDLTLPQLHKSLSSELLAALAEFFVCGGDVFSALYTGSPAMHSHLMREYTSNVPQAPSNAKIALQRRYQNVIHDKLRQTQYEMLLGRNISTYFPSLLRSRPVWVSQFPAFVPLSIPCLKVAPSMVTLKRADVLLADASVCWVCPISARKVDVLIWLSRPCQVEELVLHMRRGPVGEFPRRIDVMTGMYADRLHVAFQELEIPRCNDGTKIGFKMQSSSGSARPLYSFDSLPGMIGGSTQDLVRFVKLSCTGASASACLILGMVEVYGSLPGADDMGQKKPTSSLWSQQAALTVERLSASLQSDLSDYDKDAENSQKIQIQTETEDTDFSVERVPTTDTISTSTSTADTLSTVFTGVYIQNDDSRIARYKTAAVALMSGKSKPTLLDTLELDALRIQLEISAVERDDILYSAGLKISDFDPNGFAYPKAPKSIEFAMKQSEKSWGSTCHNCDSMLGFSRHFCTYCFKRFCGKCMSPRPMQIIENLSQSSVDVCQTCGGMLRKQRELVSHLRSASSKPLRVRGDVDGGHATADHTRIQWIAALSKSVDWSRRTSGVEQPLSVYPSAGFVSHVPTHRKSLPAEIMLLERGILPETEHHWTAPEGVTKVRLIIALSVEAIVKRVNIVADRLGYSKESGPIISIGVGKEIDHVTNNVVGTWEIGEVSPFGVKVLELADDCDETSRIVCITLSKATGDNELASSTESQWLRLGSLSIFGIPEVQGETVVPNIEQWKAYDRMMISAAPPNPPALRPLWSRFRNGNRVLDICVPDESIVQGFAASIRHADEGSVSQAKKIRITAQYIDTGTNQIRSQLLVGEFLIPQCAPHSRLFFSFSTPVHGNMFTFGMLDNYGGSELCPPRLAVF